MARDADGKPQAPLETRGRRPISQKMRDVSDRLKSIGRFAESMPAIMKSVMMASFMAWYVWSCRAQISIIKAGVNPEGLVEQSWGYTPYWDTSKSYILYGVLKGGPIAGMDVYYPDKNFAHAFLQIGVLMQATAGESMLSFAVEAGEATLIISILDDIFNRRIFVDRVGKFSEDESGIPGDFAGAVFDFVSGAWAWRKILTHLLPGAIPMKGNAGFMTAHEMWVAAGRPLPEDVSEEGEHGVDLSAWFWTWQISRLLAALAFAAVAWFLITSGPRALSLK